MIPYSWLFALPRVYQKYRSVRKCNYHLVVNINCQTALILWYGICVGVYWLYTYEYVPRTYTYMQNTQQPVQYRSWYDVVTM